MVEEAKLSWRWKSEVRAGALPSAGALMYVPTSSLFEAGRSKESAMAQKMAAFADNQKNAFCQEIQSYENKRRSARNTQSVVYQINMVHGAKTE